jgi:hypothetical protein
MKVICFESNRDIIDLERRINNWLESNPDIEIKDIKHSTSLTHGTNFSIYLYTAIILYYTKEDKLKAIEKL